MSVQEIKAFVKSKGYFVDNVVLLESRHKEPEWYTLVYLDWPKTMRTRQPFYGATLEDLMENLKSGLKPVKR